MQQHAPLGAQLLAMGQAVRLMAPRSVKPHVKTNANDAADAEAICETFAQSNMHFVPIKNAEKQAAWRCTGFAKAS
ncbi:hypothetical protein LJR139_000284 [Variovorax paradoxus]